MKIRDHVFLAALSGGSICLYILISYLVYRVGFPLDDAWIHQTYARNLTLNGEWAFIPSESSAGSTGPLWAGLLSLGYFFSREPYVWTYLLGWLSLVGIAITGVNGHQILSPENNRWSFWLGALLVFEWHLVWGAASGMETVLFALLITYILLRLIYLSKEGSTWTNNLWFIMGMLVGLSVWLRPGGITLIGPTGFVIIFSGRSWSQKLRYGLFLLLGFGLPFGIYLAFNQTVSGAWWPSTFYAKQAEYAVLRELPILVRIFRQSVIPMVGVGTLLLPGFIRKIYRAYNDRNLGIIACILWIIGYLLMYAWRLPVTYQHGRYLIPMMPIFFILGFNGMVSWIKPLSNNIIIRIMSRTWMVTTIIILFVFWAIGARSYAYDVAFIESEMVVTAKWIAKNTPPGSIIAAHDIGALGYFGERQILDMAGLISSEVIPFIRDEDQLEKYIKMRGSDYLMTFPGWYPKMTSQAKMIYQTEGQYSPTLGGENMAVYTLSLR